MNETAQSSQVVFKEKELPPPFKEGVRLTLKQRSYGHSYEPDIQRIQLHSDEVLETDRETGRLRKIVPTIIHHEYAHHAIHLLSGGTGEVEVNEGVSDALATFIAEVNPLGFHDRLNPRPTADPHARDLRLDRTAFPDSPRRTVAGALRELFRATINGLLPIDRENPDFDEEHTSDFTFELVVKWLGSKRVQDGGVLNSLPLEFSPLLGWELFVVGTPSELYEDPDGDGLTRAADLRHAFGRRNLFPNAFLRGDSNGDAQVDIADALKTLNFLFLGDKAVQCMDALDTDDSGQVDISDGILVLLFLFTGGSPPAAPALDCGWDVTSGDGLGCFQAPCAYFP